MIEVRRITPKDGLNVRFEPPIQIKEKRGWFCWFVEIQEIDLKITELHKEQLAYTVLEWMESDYREIVLSADFMLTSRAVEIKQWYLERSRVEVDK